MLKEDTIYQALEASLKSFFSSMCPLEHTVKPPEQCVVFGGWSAEVSVLGLVSGSLTFVFPQALVGEIAKHMLEDLYEGSEQDFLDTVSEVSNIVVGGLKRELSKGRGVFEQGFPQISEQPLKYNGYACAVETAWGVLWISFNLKDGESLYVGTH